MKGWRMSFIIIWKVAGELHSPKNMMSGLKSPWFMEKAAFHLSPSLSQTLLKPQRRSRVVNHSTSHNLVCQGMSETRMCYILVLMELRRICGMDTQGDKSLLDAWAEMRRKLSSHSAQVWLYIMGR